jgi:hypothetical protein
MPMPVFTTFSAFLPAGLAAVLLSLLSHEKCREAFPLPGVGLFH